MKFTPSSATSAGSFPVLWTRTHARGCRYWWTYGRFGSASRRSPMRWGRVRLTSQTVRRSPRSSFSRTRPKHLFCRRRARCSATIPWHTPLARHRVPFEGTATPVRRQVPRRSLAENAQSFLVLSDLKGSWDGGADWTAAIEPRLPRRAAEPSRWCTSQGGRSLL